MSGYSRRVVMIGVLSRGMTCNLRIKGLFRSSKSLDCMLPSSFSVYFLLHLCLI